MPKILKREAGKRLSPGYPATDYLLVEDPKNPDTWKYQVRRNGAADTQLIREAHMALKTSDRSDKGELLERLSEVHLNEVVEASIQESYYGPMMGVTSFAALRAAEKAQKATRKVHDLAYDFEQMVFAIMGAPDGDKIGMLLALADEFKQEVSNTMANDVVSYSESEPITGSLNETQSDVQVLEVIRESDVPSGPVKLKIAVIEPGWGNEADNNYYPKEVLQRDIHLFEGTKMYATDHDPKQKSVRTEVGTVLQCPSGFTETGAPIAIVGIHNPIMAEDIRNRHALGVLDRLETSILGDGVRRKGRVGARLGNIVESITRGVGIDFVTKAGAGGRALAIAESDKGANMSPEEEKPDEEKAEEKTQATDQAPVVTEAAKTTTIVYLSEAQVREIVASATLPKVAADRLCESNYLDQQALLSAITRERDYIKSITGSGTPQDNVNAKVSEAAKQPVAASGDFSGVDKVNDRYFGGSR